MLIKDGKFNVDVIRPGDFIQVKFKKDSRNGVIYGVSTNYLNILSKTSTVIHVNEVISGNVQITISPELSCSTLSSEINKKET